MIYTNWMRLINNLNKMKNELKKWQNKLFNDKKKKNQMNTIFVFAIYGFNFYANYSKKKEINFIIMNNIES